MTDHRISPIETADPDWWTTAKVAVLGTIVLVILFVFIQGLYGRTMRKEFNRKVVSEQPLELRDLRVKQMKALEQTGWVDREKGIVAIPIERAMALLAAEPNPAAPVVLAPAPVPSATPAPAPAKGK